MENPYTSVEKEAQRSSAIKIRKYKKLAAKTPKYCSHARSDETCKVIVLGTNSSIQVNGYQRKTPVLPHNGVPLKIYGFHHGHCPAARAPLAANREGSCASTWSVFPNNKSFP